MWYHKYMKYVFSAIFTKEKGGYSVLCPELDISSQGKDIVEAERNIREAVELYIKDLSNDELVSYKQAQREIPCVKTFEVSHA